MPTESTFLLAGLFFVAAALGYFFAVFGDDDEEEEELATGQLNADYIKGLNFLLNEQPDQALEVFMRMVEVDDETLETHFALGSLFRRRGELNRAIRVHQNIIARPNLSVGHREQAMVSLAEDYLSAGLFDRAEKLYQDLRESAEYGVRALHKLIRIYESTNDWEPAIEAYQALEKIEPDAGEDGRVAHYYCELAEQAAMDRDFPRARELLKKAGGGRRGADRVRLVLAGLAQETGDHKEAVKVYRQVMKDQPRLITEVVPRLAESCRELDDQNLLTKSLKELCKGTGDGGKAIALATVYDPRIVNETALECLREYVLSDEVLGNLVDTASLERGDANDQRVALDKLREGLGGFVSQTHRYRCTECGYVTSQLIWQCPTCRSWETILPAAQLSVETPVT
ncbi:MAG: tetratricopeptide repeat protein [Gammaproteobacteria bacterium]|jgi:lipopolysaccharide biosynthesis regulator YciM|nr:tetratricopeptide repeat protein [Gammaproteobacteria bacterium]MDP6616366.1 tetratricopeptide repeat protein [Gammaproteobacteria bacterium]MDP6695338.1 tetratricopeptide repeat protein [Gammaproteobacteria bacterium]MDP7041761.1 tetratricopeptide repeat protein [Gammaproteobacteria bacterium]